MSLTLAGTSDLIACTAENGLVRIGADGEVRAFPTEADAWLRRSIVQTALTLPGNRLLIASRLGGLMLLDEAGRFLRHIGEADGLRDPFVRALAVAGTQLWMASNSNLSDIDASLTATIDHG